MGDIFWMVQYVQGTLSLGGVIELSNTKNSFIILIKREGLVLHVAFLSSPERETGDLCHKI